MFWQEVEKYQARRCQRIKGGQRASRAMSGKMSGKETVGVRTIERDLARLKKMGVLTREGGRKEGRWAFLSEKNSVPISCYTIIYFIPLFSSGKPLFSHENKKQWTN